MDGIISIEFYNDLSSIIESSRKSAYQMVDRILVIRNWLLGKRIAEEELSGTHADRYGEKIVSELAKTLTEQYGKGFDQRSLYRYVQFYNTYPKIVASVKPLSSNTENQKIVASPRPLSFLGVEAVVCTEKLLSWTHYKALLQVTDPDARLWYEKEAYEQTWSVRTLQRNISTQYYDRMLLSHNSKAVENEMKQLTSEYQGKLEFIRNPVIAEFLGMQEDTSYLESDLEQAIIGNLQRFLMELGKGYAFVARQQHIHTEKQDYYIDLVFYNYILQCFVLIDLKIGKITHQDVGQMDMYVRMYDELKRGENHNPTLGIVLCSETDEDIARYSVLHGNEQLFAAKYRLCLPTEEQLRAEIETQKGIFYLQHPELKEEL
ncbi:PDDEXK nuclease domain-containing protein [uncultured Ruminobacter sp.]|uniref:PDDEXK nuclease domain-containing protein n=1 Tax=uncultured Ruminobacter sp. TaxID=538947 RepID=UPI0025FF1ED2|nr:PDDEXK nuclease domain-containing protein [uncultured Ruminobacter sp.]